MCESEVRHTQPTVQNTTASTGTTYSIIGTVTSACGFSGHFTGGKFYVQQNAGFIITSPNETQDVNGTAQIGSSGIVFAGIREVICTTGHITNVSYPSGYTMTNTKILSIEINNAGLYWSTLGM